MKRLVKLAISLLARAGDTVSARAAALRGRAVAPPSVILYYHAVPAFQRARFGLQMDELLRRSVPVSATGFSSLPPGRGGCAVTFDDGFVSVLANALPELERRDIPATLFVPTGSLGHRPAWITHPAAPNFQEQVMSERQVAALANHPLVTIGSHSVSHPRLTALSDTDLARELSQSKSDLERILDHEVSLFSFPHGAHDQRVLNGARHAGYRRVFSIAPRCVATEEDSFVYGRFAVDPSETLLEFSLKVRGAYRWVGSQARASRRQPVPACPCEVSS